MSLPVPVRCQQDMLMAITRLGPPHFAANRFCKCCDERIIHHLVNAWGSDPLKPHGEKLDDCCLLLFTAARRLWCDIFSGSVLSSLIVLLPDSLVTMYGITANQLFVGSLSHKYADDLQA